MKRCLVLASSFLLAALTFGQDHRDLSGLPAIFVKSIRVHRTSRYSGERTVMFKKGADRLTHDEYVLKDGRKTRIEFPDGSDYKGQIIVENEKQRMHYFPDRNEIEVEPRRDRDSNHFRFRPGDAERPKITAVVKSGGTIAGFATQLVIVSDSNGNAVQQNWIEPKSGVVLRRVLFDKVGTQTGSFEFTRINFTPRFEPGDFAIDRKGAAIITPDIQANRAAKKLGLSTVKLMPGTGYQLENARIIHPDNREVLIRSYISDTGRFSLSQTKGQIDPARLQKLAKGRLSTYSWKQGGESFALIGNLTQDQLQQLARSFGDG